MKKLAGLVLAVTTLTDTAISACPNLAYKEAPPLINPWAGFKVGVAFGCGYGRTRHNLDVNGNFTEFNTGFAGVQRVFTTSMRGKADYQTKGLLGGMYTGYDFPINDIAIVGANVSFDFVDIKKTSQYNAAESVVNLTDPNFVHSAVLSRTITVKEKISSTTAIMARLGLANDKILYYLGTGWVISRWKTTTTFGSDFINVEIPGFVYTPVPAGDTKTTKTTKTRHGIRFAVGTTYKVNSVLLGLEGTWDIYKKQQHNFGMGGSYIMFPPQLDPATYTLNGRTRFKSQVLAVKATLGFAI